MNTHLYCPKDDPYHRERWMEAYPEAEWSALHELIPLAQRHGIDFVYGFSPGKGLRFSANEPVRLLLAKAERFHAAGVRTFAILFDDIPARLQHAEDREQFADSMARAQGVWLQKIVDQQPASWAGVEWWICPSYYTEDPLLERMFGPFEPSFLETLAQYLPQSVPILWTGPSVVSRKISLSHVTRVARRARHRLILWDNYPVNDLSMSTEMHLSPLTGRDPRLPQKVYGYLNNPLLQETLSFIPLATCFDYAADPASYDPEKSWERVIRERFGEKALARWRAIRDFCERVNRRKDKIRPPRLPAAKRAAFRAAHSYLVENGSARWFEEFRPWLELLERSSGS